MASKRTWKPIWKKCARLRQSAIAIDLFYVMHCIIYMLCILYAQDDMHCMYSNIDLGFPLAVLHFIFFTFHSMHLNVAYHYIHLIICILFYAFHFMHSSLLVSFYSYLSIHFIRLNTFKLLLKLVGDWSTNQPTDRLTNRLTDIVTYRAAIANKNRTHIS